MPRRILLLIILLAFCHYEVGAEGYTFNYDSDCSLAYEYYMSLHLAEGNAIIRREIIAHPYNLMATYIADYDDCLLLLMNGDREDYDQRKDHMDERLDLLARGDENSPWYRLCRAGIYLHWALVNIRFGENFKAATTFRRSFLLLKENQERFPNFEYNQIFYGMEKAVVGAIPEDYKWMAAVFGMRGNVKQGIGLLDQFIAKHTNQQPLRLEALVFDSYLKFYLLYKQEEVWNFVNSDQFPIQNNLLQAFVRGNLAINYRKSGIAVETLKEAEKIKECAQYPVFDFEMGNALLLQLNPECLRYFGSYLAHYRGKLFVRDTWQKMAEMYYLQGDMTHAQYCRGQIKQHGNAQVDADKQATRFANSTNWPDRTLLKAHLLIDGGSYKQALDQLITSKEQDFRTVPDKLEYNFRLGRAYDESGMDSQALRYYQATVNMGKERVEYFAARAALQMAFIYERMGNTQAAIAKYKECLSMRGHDYQSSIDEQAKAGLNRLTVK